jgi:GAF domain-containing protein/HAMP domain-containing protein
MTPLALDARAAAAPRRRRGGASLALKLAFAFLGLVALVLIVNGAVDTYLTYNQAKRAALEVEAEKARGAAERVGAFLTDIRTELGWTAGVEWGYAKLEQQRYDFIRLLRQTPAVTALSYIDGRGKEQIAVSRLEPDSIGSGKDFSADPRFVRAVADKIWFGPVEFRRGSEPYMTIALAHVGKTPGVTVADVNLKLVWDVVTAIHVGANGFAYVVDDRGRLIAHPDLSLVLRDSDFSALPQVAEALKARGDGAAEVAKSPDGAAVLTAFAIEPKTHWAVFVEQPLSEALAAAYATLARAAGLLGLGLLLAAVSGVALARRMAAPIRQLQAGAERLGAGDLSQRLDVRSGDEIEALAGGFNRMAERLQESYENLEAKVEARTRDLGVALERQTATSDILRVISQSPTDAKPVFESIVSAASRLLRCDWAFVMLVDGKSWWNAATATPAGLEKVVLTEKFPVDPDANFPSRAIVDKTIVHLPDWSDMDLPEHQRRVRGLYDIQASLHLPFLRDGECVGVLTLLSRRARAFGDAEIAQAEAFRDQALIAIENARLFNETQEALKQQTATADVLRTISRSAFDLGAVLTALIESAIRLTGAARGVVWLAGDGGLRVAAHVNYTPEWLAMARDMILKPAPDSPTATGLAAFLGAVVNVEDSQTDPRFAHLPLHGVGDYRGALAVPLKRDGAVVGVISLSRPEALAFTERQVALVESFADQAVVAMENARLFNEVQARTRDLEQALKRQTATSEILRVISESPTDAKPVFDRIVETAAKLMRCDLAFVMLTDGREWWGAALAVPDGLVPEMTRNRLPVDAAANFPSRAILSRAMLFLPDWAEIDLPEHEAFVQSHFGINSSIYLPFLREGECIGLLVLASKAPNAFAPADVAQAESFRDQAVIAIQNARLFNETKEALERQTATAEILKVIASSPSDTQPVFEAIVTSAKRLLGARAGVLTRFIGDNTHLAAFTPVDAEHDAAFAAAFPRPADLISQALRAGRMVLVDDTLSDDDWGWREGGKIGIRSGVNVPLISQGTTIGGLTVNSSEPRAFDPDDVELLRTFADQAVIAIENARLLNETQESLAQQTATADVLKVISRSVFDLDTVLQTLIDTAVRLTRGNRGTIFLRQDDLLVARAFHSNVPEPLRAYLASTPWPLDGDSHMARAAREREVVHVADLSKSGVKSDSEIQKLASFGAGLWTPLMRKGEVIGVFGVPRDEPIAFSEREIDLVQTFADQAVIAIENSRLFEQVQARTRELEQSLSDLRKAQDRLVQSEKLASLGQLTAGIAHEIKNPLNFVNNFATLSRELLDELRETLQRLPDDAKADADDLMGMIDSNLEKVASHGKRADSIVKNMLLHSREGSGERAKMNVNAMVEEALNLGYHGARAEKPGFNVTIEKSLDPDAGEADLYLQEVTRVLLNLISNGFYASAKRKQSEGPDYEPTLRAATRSLGRSVEIRIRDNGTGIPDDVRAKVFNPFFTTKPAGEGTGLGLSLSHDIVVKQHGGTLDVETAPGAFTEFIITLPREGTKS